MHTNDLIVISGAHHDRELVRGLRKVLAGRGYRVWSTDDVPAGVAWEDATLQAIRRCTAAVMLVSEQFAASNTFYGELGFVMSRRQEASIPVIPVVTGELDPARLPTILRKLQVLDARELSPEEIAARIAATLEREAVPS